MAKAKTTVLDNPDGKVVLTRRVQVRTFTVINPNTKEREINFRAVTLDGKKEVHGDGETEAEAIRALERAFKFAESLHETRRQYPKTVEVDW